MSRHFCIVSMPRCGSNRLHSLLNSHRQIVCHGELFNRHAIYSLLDPWPEVPTARRVMALLARYSRPRGFLDEQMRQSRIAWPTAEAIGFKLFPYHNRRILEHVCDVGDFAVIYLKRGNLLLQYASDRLARSTGVWSTTRAGSHRKAAEKIEFSMHDFTSYAARLDGYDKRVRSALGNREFLEVMYEDLDSSLSSVQDFLGVDVEDNLRSRIRKQNPDDWTKRFSNPDRVRNALAPTRWAMHLQ